MKNRAGQDVPLPDEVWAGVGGAAGQRIRIVDTRRDGRVVFERIAGAAFEPTGDYDFGQALHGPFLGNEYDPG